MGMMPVSRRTVATQMQLEPDMGGVSSGSMMMKPIWASGCLGGTSRFTWRKTPPRGSFSTKLRSVWSLGDESRLFPDRVAGRRRHAAHDDVADLAFGMAVDDVDGLYTTHFKGLPRRFGFQNKIIRGGLHSPQGSTMSTRSAPGPSGKHVSCLRCRSCLNDISSGEIAWPC